MIRVNGMMGAPDDQMWTAASRTVAASDHVYKAKSLGARTKLGGRPRAYRGLDRRVPMSHVGTRAERIGLGHQ